MDYRYEIARRYLRSRHTLVSRITLISVAGVGVGVAALIVVLSVMNGFFSFVRDMLVSFDPHVRIEAVESGGIGHPDSLSRIVQAVPHVLSAAPYVEGKALLAHDGAGEINKVVVVRGVDPDRSSSMAEAVERSGYGTFDLSRRNGRPGIVLGRALGERMALTPGGGTIEPSRISLLSAPAIERAITHVVGAAPTRPFDVRGLYALQAVFDESYVFIDLNEAQRLFRLGKNVSGIDLRLDDLDEAAGVKADISALLDPAVYRVRTWYDLQKSLYDVMRLEKWGATLILALIIVVAAFNIIGSLTMIVIDKRRDVGVLRAMGVSRKGIRHIFLLEGLLIGAAGSGAGLVGGLVLSLLQQRFGLVPLSGGDAFLIDAYPVAIEATDVVLVAVVALALCVAAAVYPARRASAIEPARAVAMDA